MAINEGVFKTWQNLSILILAFIWKKKKNEISNFAGSSYSFEGRQGYEMLSDSDHIN